jgi:hypothetical protein
MSLWLVNEAWHYFGEAIHYPNWNAVSAVIQAFSAVTILIPTYRLVRVNRELVIATDQADPLVDIVFNYVDKRFYIANYCSYPVYGVSIDVFAQAEARSPGGWHYTYSNSVADLKKLPARTSWNPSVAVFAEDIVRRMLRHERAKREEALTSLSATLMTFRVVYHRDFDNRRFSMTFEAEIAKSGNGPIFLVPKGGGTPIIRDPGEPESEGPPIPVLKPNDVEQPTPVPIAKGFRP